ncbi:MAG: DUF1467 family protein [Sphingomonadales bacterium]
MAGAVHGPAGGGAPPPGEVGEHQEPGAHESAPFNPRIGRKMLITTGIATVIWLAYWFIVGSGLVNRDMLL